jgi:hypothetical protein
MGENAVKVPPASSAHTTSLLERESAICSILEVIGSPIRLRSRSGCCFNEDELATKAGGRILKNSLFL